MCSAGSLVALLSAAVLSGHFAAGEQPPASRKPNFVVFVVDDLGYNDVGCFGNHSLPTPNIDSLCETGVKLAHNLAASPVCTPSRAALLTGRYPVEIGMEASRLNRVFLNLGSTGGLPPDVTTFPTILRQEAGYSTALVGKWHLGLHCGFPPDFCHHPNSHGFDYFYGLPLTNVRDFGNDETTHSSVLRPFAHLIKTLWVSLAVSFIMFLYFITKRSCCFSLVCLAISIAIMLVVMPLHNFRAFSGVLMRNTEVIQQPVDLDGLTGRYVQEALNYLHNQDENKPFLLFMAFTHVHTALVPGKGFKGRSNFGPYGDAVLEVDWAVGEVLQKLDDLKLTEDTVIYFTSDNGAHQEETMGDGTPAGGSNYPFKGGKGMGSMEGGIRVPSIIKYPRKFPPGQVVNVPTSQMDLLPTFANLAGVKLWENLTQVDGRDLSNLLSGQTDQSPHSVLLHYCGTYLHGARWVEDHKKVWKVRFAQPKFVPGTHRCEFLCFCSPGDVDILEPPLLFNVQEDLTEDEPVDPNSELYDKVMGMIAEKIREHELAMEEDPPEDQFSVLNSIWRPWLQPCCDFGKMCSCNENSD